MNLKFPEVGGLEFVNDKTGEEFKYSEKLTELFNATTDEDISDSTKEFAQFFNDNMWYLPVTEKYYIFRIHSSLSIPPNSIICFIWMLSIYS